MSVKRIAFAGASNRALGMFVKNIRERYAQYAVPAGIYDINPKRSEYIGARYDVPV